MEFGAECIGAIFSTNDQVAPAQEVGGDKHK
jgi:hypothetical protein